ncbi:hypothetical protein Pmar_PMAR027242 [Perkinsus marinus ATCC 50983]|uniref:Uncharacterized protein n=1 Tax=Perkinsus marinus (strain ATCC 50983 / TXsc) TaxID=423536 RepID=C5LWY0_PERM5|nr:hypothetical protein Pmar_PMAR027242 [Perkinsus marinus ATCC 50983]EEQ98758.1 hypothetical protein Pmar_PMAR027242 [Perkinsus marinus ATCC 50983]|eukprot:XP_002766041.1 hypothetical protein Pmar_PMAR027242 [Perkinsus marinus ATCC 50983]
MQLMRPAEISMVIHYMTKARYEDRDFWRDLRRELCCNSVTASFRVRDLSMVVGSLNSVELLDAQTLACLTASTRQAACTLNMDSLMPLIRTYIKLTSPEGVLKALGATDFYPITSMCADYLLNRPAVVTSSNVVEIFSGLATLKYDGKHCYEALLRKCRFWILTMPYEAVAILLQSMARVKMRDSELEGKIALRLANDIEKATTSEEIASIAVWMGSLTHHFSKLHGESHPTLQKTIINHLPSVVHTMSAECLMLTVPPLPLLLTGTPPRNFRDAIFSEKCRQELPSFIKEGLCAIMSAAYRLGYTYDTSWWEEASELTVKPVMSHAWSAVSVATVAYQLTHLGEAEHNIHATLDQLKAFRETRSEWFTRAGDSLAVQIGRWPPRPVSTLLACFIRMNECPHQTTLERALDRVEVDIDRYDGLSLTQVITAMAKFNLINIAVLEDIERNFKSGRVKFSRSQLRAVKRAYDDIGRDKACMMIS